MLNDPDDSYHSAGPGPYPFPPSQSTVIGGRPQPMMEPNFLRISDPQGEGRAQMNQVFDSFDPMLDTDPFGFTASTYSPTQITSQEGSMRR